MTRFENRLKLNQELEAKTYKEAVWCLLIAYGGALVNQDPVGTYGRDRYGNYYGSFVDVDADLTASTLAYIKEHGIDFEASSDPAPETDYRFNGTFTSSQYEVHVLAGTLVLGDGQKVEWGTQLRNPDFGALIRLLTADNTPINTAINEAIDHLKHRVKTYQTDKAEKGYAHFVAEVPSS